MKYALALLAVLLIAAPSFAADVAPFMGVGIGRQPDGEPFNIGWAGGKLVSSDDGNTELLMAVNYGQFVAENLDALGGSLILKSKWWEAVSTKPILRDLWLCLDVGFMDKFRQTEEGDRAIAFKVAPFLSSRVTDVFSVQAGYCGFNSGPSLHFDSFWWGGITASTSLVFGGK